MSRNTTNNITNIIYDELAYQISDEDMGLLEEWDEIRFINTAKEIALRGTETDLISNTLCETPTICADEIDNCSEIATVDNIEFFCSQYSVDVVHINVNLKDVLSESNLSTTEFKESRAELSMCHDMLHCLF